MITNLYILLNNNITRIDAQPMVMLFIAANEMTEINL